MGAVIRGGEEERKREKRQSRARRRHGDRDRAERTYEPRGGETKVDKDDGMKEGDDVYGTTGWWGKLGEVEEDSHGAPRGGGAGQCFVVYTHTHTHTHTHTIYSVNATRDGCGR